MRFVSLLLGALLLGVWADRADAQELLPLNPTPPAGAPGELGHALEESLNLWPAFNYARQVSPAGNAIHESWHVLWPLFGVWQDEARGESGFGAPWPLIAGTFGEEHAHFRIAPLFYWWKWNEERAVFLFPLGGGFWNPDGWTLMLPFFYSQHDRDTSRNILLPFLWVFSEPKGGVCSLWPVWHAAWRTRPGGAPAATYVDVAPLTLLPLGAWDAEWARSDTYWSVAWPLGPTYQAKDNAWGFRFLWEGLVCWSEHERHFGWRLLGGLFGVETERSDGRLTWIRWTILWVIQLQFAHVRVISCP